MEIQQAKELVVEAGKRLVESGLIARTWGNVSCRVSDTQFVITPSGRAYETLTPEEIVLVNIADCEYEGEIKPSSEKGIHADSYRLRPDVNFVIHTHQVYASVLSPMGISVKNVYPDAARVIGNEVLCADYGMPSTGKLRKGVEEALLKAPDSKAFIMKHHGALCLGKDYDESFQVASVLEDVCRRVIKEKYLRISGETCFDVNNYREYYLAQEGNFNGMPETVSEFYCSERCGEYFKLYSALAPEDYMAVRIDTGLGEDGIAPKEAKIHAAIYRETAANNIIHVTNGDVVAVSAAGKAMKPLLDDFAQIVGTTVPCVKWEDNSSDKSAKAIAAALKGRNAVLVEGCGAICTGPSESDAFAAELVMDKGCKTQIGATLFHRVNVISPLECKIMRIIYTTKYSKKAAEK